MARGGIVVLSNCTKRSKEYYDSPLRVRSFARRQTFSSICGPSISRGTCHPDISSVYISSSSPPDSGINFDVAFCSIRRIGVFFSLEILREFSCVCKLSV